MRSPTRTGLLPVLAFISACAVGPSTRVSTTAVPVTSRIDDVRPSASRALLDSLDGERTAERVNGVASGERRVDSTRSTEASNHQLWVPTQLTVDAATDLAWLDVLRDPQLVALVREAVANNRDLRMAQGRVREYRALLGVARSSFVPSVSVTGGGGRNQSALGANVLSSDVVRITTDLSWELDFWGGIRRRAEAARYDLGARDEDTRATTLTLVSSVATAYLQLRELDESVRTASQTLASRRATLDIARLRFRQGLTSELDVRQFEAELADPAARLAALERDRLRAENQLSQLVGRAPGPIARGRPLAEIVQAVTVPDSIPATLIARRPDVRSAERALQGSMAGIGVAVANRLPSITLGGQYGTQRPDFSRLFEKSGEIYTWQVGISVPLFNGGRLRDEERAARARADQARSQYEQSVLTALQESSDALSGVRLGRDQLVAQATQTQALERAFAIAEARYRNGVSSYLEVLDAQRQLFGAQLGLAQVERQYLASMVELYRALGGGWNGAGNRR